MRKRRAEETTIADAEGPGRVRRLNEARILEAAERVFAEAGYGGATMAQIAAVANLPKANLHYYFRTKEILYRALLSNILELWLDAADAITPDEDPATALGDYIRAKMEHSRRRPFASKVFANEILHGAPHLTHYLGIELKRRVDEKASIIERWIADGRMASLDPRHLFFMLWAMTQTYADFEAQIRAVLGVEHLDDRDFEVATQTVTTMVLRGCGLTPETRHAGELAKNAING